MSEPISFDPEGGFPVVAGASRRQRTDLQETIREGLRRRGASQEQVSQMLPTLMERATSNPREIAATSDGPSPRRVQTQALLVKSADGNTYGMRRWRSRVDVAQASRQIAELVREIEAAHVTISSLLMAVREIAIGGDPLAVLSAYNIEVRPLMTRRHDGNVANDVVLVSSPSDKALAARYREARSVVGDVFGLPAVVAPEPVVVGGDGLVEPDDSAAIQSLSEAFGLTAADAPSDAPAFNVESEIQNLLGEDLEGIAPGVDGQPE